MTFFVKEILCSLPREGYNDATFAVFCRISGSNLWYGREEHRSREVCKFCDTDFVGTDGEGVPGKALRIDTEAPPRRGGRCPPARRFWRYPCGRWSQGPAREH